MFYVYRHATKHNHANIILEIHVLSSDFVLKYAAKISNICLK